MAQRKPVDSEAIEREYRAGQLSLREIAKRNGVTDTAIRYGAGHLAEPLKLTAGKKRHALVVLA